MFYYSLSKIITELTATVLNWNTKKKLKRHKNRTIDNKCIDWWNKSLNHDLHWALYFTWFWFWEIPLLLPNFYQTCLILKSSLLLLIHSRPSLFYRYCLFSAFFVLVFVDQKATDLHLLFIIYYNKFPPDSTRNEDWL